MVNRAIRVMVGVALLVAGMTAAAVADVTVKTEVLRQYPSYAIGYFTAQSDVPLADAVWVLIDTAGGLTELEPYFVYAEDQNAKAGHNQKSWVFKFRGVVVQPGDVVGVVITDQNGTESFAGNKVCIQVTRGTLCR